MTVTIQQLYVLAQAAPQPGQVIVTGTSGEDYPITGILADGDVLRIRVEDEVTDADDDGEDDDEDDEE